MLIFSALLAVSMCLLAVKQQRFGCLLDRTMHGAAGLAESVQRCHFVTKTV